MEVFIISATLICLILSWIFSYKIMLFNTIQSKQTISDRMILQLHKLILRLKSNNLSIHKDEHKQYSNENFFFNRNIVKLALFRTWIRWWTNFTIPVKKIGYALLYLLYKIELSNTKMESNKQRILENPLV